MTKTAEISFKRARSQEQREQRRQVILATAAAMLTEMPVSELSLNELSRRVGLAKSNVLRYFESREAVLLDLLDAELLAWIEALQDMPPRSGGTVRDRGDDLAAAMVSELAGRPVLCDLIGAQAAVLERNVSTKIAVNHKRANLDAVRAITAVILDHLPEFTAEEAVKVFAYFILMTSAAWPRSRPTQAVQAAYDADPEISAMHMDFKETVKDIVRVTIAGILFLKSGS